MTRTANDSPEERELEGMGEDRRIGKPSENVWPLNSWCFVR